MDAPWHKQVADFLEPGSVVVGIGNRLRGDDAFGPELIDRLRDRVPWRVWDAGETPENDVGRIAAMRPRSVLLVDVVDFEGAPGRVRLFRPDDIPWGGVSTHAASLRLFVEFLAARAACPVALLGIQPQQMRLGAGLSAAVRPGLDHIARQLTRQDSPGGRTAASPARPA